MAGKSDKDWVKWGDQDPYYGVTTSPEYRREQITEAAKEKFFATGEAHIERLFKFIGERFSGSFMPKKAMDFGSGTGRLLIPLARRCESVTGVDVSPGMRAEAAANCAALGLQNVAIVPSDDQLTQVEHGFNFVHSTDVFQHIDPRRGEKIIAQLFARVAPGGIAALQILIAIHHPRATKLAVWLRDNIPGTRGVMNTLRGRQFSDPIMEGHCYSLNRLFELGYSAGMDEAYVCTVRHQQYVRAEVVMRKS